MIDPAKIVDCGDSEHAGVGECPGCIAQRFTAHQSGELHQERETGSEPLVADVPLQREVDT